MMTPLHHLGSFIREMLLLVPLPVVRGMFLAIPIVLLIWVLQLPREQTVAPGKTGRWTGNLKVIACVALLIQILIYSML